MENLKDFIGDWEYPSVDALTNMEDDTIYSYVNSTFCIGFLNKLRNISTYMIARYSIDENFDTSDTATWDDNSEKLIPYFNNIEELNNVSAKDWIHTDYGKYCIDDVIAVGESEENYWCVWLDKDVSDCCIMKVAKEHYSSINEFNEAILEYFEKTLNYKIKPIRKPDGWIQW